MIEEQNLTEETTLITEADLYFPDKKVAIFCDSTRHHRSKKVRQKDERISNVLNEIGIRSIRVQGSHIVNKLNRTVNEIIEQL
jgi:very-short-patch-repair endonuclease